MQVSYQRNYYPHYVYARELISKGAIGPLRGVVSYITQNWTSTGGWRLDPELAGGGMFMDSGSHLVASTLWMTGLEVAEVCAFMDNDGMKVDINAVINVRFKDGASGTLNTFGNARSASPSTAPKAASFSTSISGSSSQFSSMTSPWRFQRGSGRTPPMPPSSNGFAPT